MAAPDNKDDYRDTCVICLSPLTSRAIAYPCNHLTFDYACLSSWLSHRPNCPLCNTRVQQVEYDYRSPTDFKTQLIRSPSPSPSIEQAQRPRLRPRHRPRTRFHQPPPTPDIALSRRRLVHLRQAYSLHAAPRGPPLTPAMFRGSEQLQRKARVFLRRELRVFTHLLGSDAGAGVRRLEFVVEYAVGILRRLEIKGADGAAEGLLAEILGRREARLVLHELAGWLGSAFERLEDWDRAVQYGDAVITGRGKGRS